MKHFAALGVDTAVAMGASYADARVVEERRQCISTKNGELSYINESEEAGIGIRVISDGAWGFASCSELTDENIKKTAALALKIAAASCLFRKARVELAEEAAVQDSWKAPFKVDPFGVPLESKIDLLLEVDGTARKVKGVITVHASMDFRRKKQVFASSEGSIIEQEFILTGAGFSVWAKEGDTVCRRSYPTSFDGQWEAKGYEVVEEADMVANAGPMAEECAALLSAPECPCGEKDVILGGAQLALQIHESCGHPVELDRVLGHEANFAGTSFLTLDKVGNFRYGSSAVNIVSDARQEHGAGPGTFGYDDEGVPARCSEIVKEGLFVGYLSSRETARTAGLARSSGASRADGWNRIPMVRMTNVSLLPGEWDLEGLISETKDGIFMETNYSWSIDSKRYNFQFSTEYGWEIKDGKRTRLIRMPSYCGITPEFWNSCDAVCSGKYWKLWGVPNCGKGQPEQVIATGHGAAPARFRKVKVGVTG